MLAHLKTLATWGYELSSIPMSVLPLKRPHHFLPILTSFSNQQTTKWNITCRIADAWMQKAKRLIISSQYWHDLDQTGSQLRCTDCNWLNTHENIISVCIVLRKWSNKKPSEFVGASLYSAAVLQAMNLRNRLKIVLPWKGWKGDIVQNIMILPSSNGNQLSS